jgi:hypothetical protein
MNILLYKINNSKLLQTLRTMFAIIVTGTIYTKNIPLRVVSYVLISEKVVKISY